MHIGGISSHCTTKQAVLSLPCSHISKGPFTGGVTRIYKDTLLNKGSREKNMAFRTCTDIEHSDQTARVSMSA